MCNPSSISSHTILTVVKEVFGTTIRWEIISVRKNATVADDSRSPAMKSEQRICRLAAWQNQAQGLLEPCLPVAKYMVLERLECVPQPLLGNDLQYGVYQCSGISVTNRIVFGVCCVDCPHRASSIFNHTGVSIRSFMNVVLFVFTSEVGRPF